VVGVLVEVPVMLSVVAIVNRSKGWYEARSTEYCLRFGGVTGQKAARQLLGGIPAVPL
jgi:hypothetical protein